MKKLALLLVTIVASVGLFAVRANTNAEATPTPTATVVPCDWQAAAVPPAHPYRTFPRHVYYSGTPAGAATWRGRHASWCVETYFMP